MLKSSIKDPCMVYLSSLPDTFHASILADLLHLILYPKLLAAIHISFNPYKLLKDPSYYSMGRSAIIKDEPGRIRSLEQSLPKS